LRDFYRLVGQPAVVAARDAIGMSVVGAILRSCGRFAQSGAKRDNTTAPDLALLDMRMPKMYGHELYDEMKKIDGYA